MRRAARIDDNQNQIVKLLRKIPGVSVAITSSLGQGFPDLVVGYNLSNFLIEVKDENKIPSKRKLTPDEKEFHDDWTGQVCVCKNLDEILKVLGIKKPCIHDYSAVGTGWYVCKHCGDTY